MAAVDARDVEFGLLPCENTIYGPIARAYDLLLQYDGVAIVDETSHAIVQNLIGAPGATLEVVERILSHPVALEQCGAFLKARPHIKIEPVADTAGAVRGIVEGGDRRAAAIGSRLAAEIYGGVVLAPGVQDDRENVTRFLVIARDGKPRRHLGRMCVAFSLPHEPGSLYRALGAFAQRGLNLRSLVARPKERAAFEYRFVVELDWPPALEPEAFQLPGSLDVRVLGKY